MKVLFSEVAGVDPEKLIGGINRDFNRVFAEARLYKADVSTEDDTVVASGVVTAEVETTEEIEPGVELPTVERGDDFTDIAPEAIEPEASDPTEGEVDTDHIKEDGSEGEAVETVGPVEVHEDNVHEVAEQFINHINDTVAAASGEAADVDTPIASNGGEASTDDSTDVDAPVSDIKTEDGDVQKVDAITVEVNV